jgi:hypothetical protein
MQDLTTSNSLTIEGYTAYVNSLPYSTIQAALIAADQQFRQSLLSDEPRETRAAIKRQIIICQRALTAAAGLS